MGSANIPDGLGGVQSGGATSQPSQAQKTGKGTVAGSKVTVGKVRGESDTTPLMNQVVTPKADSSVADDVKPLEIKKNPETLSPEVKDKVAEAAGQAGIVSHQPDDGGDGDMSEAEMATLAALGLDLDQTESTPMVSSATSDVVSDSLAAEIRPVRDSSLGQERAVGDTTQVSPTAHLDRTLNMSDLILTIENGVIGWSSIGEVSNGKVLLEQVVGRVVSNGIEMPRRYEHFQQEVLRLVTGSESWKKDHGDTSPKMIIVSSEKWVEFLGDLREAMQRRGKEKEVIEEKKTQLRHGSYRGSVREAKKRAGDESKKVNREDRSPGRVLSEEVARDIQEKHGMEYREAERDKEDFINAADIRRTEIKKQEKRIKDASLD